MSQRRPNTDVTGDVAAHGFTHNGIHHDIERICPLEPRTRLTLFPTLVTPVENVRISSLVERAPERVLRLVFVVARLPDNVVRLVLVVERFPERVEREPESVATDPERVDTVHERVFTDPERVLSIPVIDEMVPERAFCALELVK